MAAIPRKSRKAKADATPHPSQGRVSAIFCAGLRGFGGVAVFFVLRIVVFPLMNLPAKIYRLPECLRLGAVRRDLVSWKAIAPV